MKKVLSMALALVMVLGVVPMLVPAAKAEEKSVSQNGSVYRVDTPPTIDGTMSSGEWGNLQLLVRPFAGGVVYHSVYLR